MACASCSANVERKLNSLDGINNASVSLAGRTALVDYDPQQITLDTMKKEINDIGYDLIIDENVSASEVQKREYTRLKRATLLSWALSVFGMAVNMHWINVGGTSLTNQVALAHSSGQHVLLRTVVLRQRRKADYP